MKALRSLLVLIVIIFTVNVGSAQKGPQSTDSATKPIRGIDVIVKKDPGSAARQTAQPNKDGSFSVNLPEPGQYTITYANGAMKGQLIKEMTVSKAGPVHVNATAASQ